MKYAGIGSRETPLEVLNIMTTMAMVLGMKGYILSTGAAKGADQAFARGAMAVKSPVKLCLPWYSYESSFVDEVKNTCETDIYVHEGYKHFELVKKFHPAADRLKNSVMKLHARNVEIVSGCDFVVCWTPGGAMKGGTAMGIRIANEFKIPVYNLANQSDCDSIMRLLL